MDLITKNGPYRLPLIQKIGKRDFIKGYVNFQVQVPPEIREVTKEIIKEIPVEVVRDVCSDAAPAPPGIGEIRERSGIGQMEIYQAFQNYFVGWPSVRFLPYLTWGGYTAIDKDSMLNFLKYLKPRMSEWWRYNSGNSKLMCVGVAADCSVFAHRWFPALAFGVAWGIPKYKVDVSHMFNIFYSIDRKLYLYDAMQHPDELIEFNDPRVGLGNTLQVLLMF